MNPSARRDFKNGLFDQFARVGKALASGRRLEIIELLAQRERTVEEVARVADLSVANASQHLRLLLSAGLVEARKDRLFVRYRLADERVFHLWQAVREVGEHRIAEIDRLVRSVLTDRSSLQAVALAELRRKLREGSLVVLDVRPPEEFAAGHIPGARNIPLAELGTRLKSLPRNRQIVAYCRGPYCVLADDAVAILRAKGLNALRLDQGFPDWKAQGHPVETSVPV